MLIVLWSWLALTQAFACECTSNQPFVQSAVGKAVVIVDVLGHRGADLGAAKLVDVQVTDVLHGESVTSLSIRGSRGKDCRLPASSLVKGQRYALVLTAPKDGQAHVSTCGTQVLNVVDGKVTGRLSATPIGDAPAAEQTLTIAQLVEAIRPLGEFRPLWAAGQAAMLAGEHDKAATAFAAAAASTDQPDAKDPALVNAGAAFQAAMRLEQAAAAYEAHQQLFSASDSAEFVGMALFQVYQKLGRKSDSARVGERFLAAFPKSPHAQGIRDTMAADALAAPR